MIVRPLLLAITVCLCIFPALAQKDLTPPTALLTQKLTRHEQQRLGYGGTVSIVGAPVGSISIEGWPRNEVELTAQIEWQAPTQEDLVKIVVVNNFGFDTDGDHIRILTTGTHDK